MTWKSYVSHPWTLLFFYCLLIATFVTVAIYVYAGEQEYLETRKFGDIVTRNRTLNGILKENRDIVTLSNGDTLEVSNTKSKIFKINPTAAGWEVTLPSKDTILNGLAQRQDGSAVDFGTIFNISATESVNVVMPNGSTTVPGGDTDNYTLGTGESASLLFFYDSGEVDWYP